MPVSDIINTWFTEKCACGALARDTEAYNQVVTALPDLIARLSPSESPDAPAAGKSKT